MNIPLNQLAMIVFLLANLVIGLYASRGIKTMNDYTHSNKALGGGVLVATLIVTLLDSGILELKVTYNKGVLALLSPLGLAIIAAFLGFWVFPKLVSFRQEKTLADVMHTMYGPFARYMTVGISTIFCLGIIVSQLVAISGLSSLMGINATMLVIVLGTIITLYTVFGGIRSVAKTDVLQFMIVLLGMFVFAKIVLAQFGGIAPVIDKLPAEKLAISAHPEFRGRLVQVFFWSVFPTFLISPAIIQRVLIPREKQSIRTMFLSFSVVHVFITTLMGLVGLTLLFKKDFVLTKKMELGTVIEKLCDSQTGQLLFLLGFAAVVMSTIDSLLNSLAVLWVHDVIRPLNREVNDTKAVGLVRLCTLVLGALAIGLFFVNPFTSMELRGYSGIVFSAITIPFLMALIGLKGSQRSFVYSLVAYFGTMGALFLLYKLDVSSVKSLLRYIKTDFFMSKGVSIRETFLIFRPIWLLSLIVSGPVFFLAHYVEQGTWQWVDREKDNWKETASYSLGSFFQWTYQPVTWANEKLKKYGHRPFVMGFFTIVYCLFPYITNTKSTDTYLTIGLLRAFPIVLCGLLMVQKHWTANLKPYVSLFYYLTLLYAYPFLTTLTAFMDPQGYMTLFYIAIGILALGMMVDWSSFTLLNTLGIPLALLVNRVRAGSWIPSFGSHGGAPLFVAIFFPILAVVLFMPYIQERSANYKEENDRLQEIKKTQLLTYEDNNQQVYQTLHKKSTMMQSMERVASELQAEGGHDEQVLTITEAMNHFYSIAQRSQEYLHLDIKPVPLSEILDQAYEQLVRKGIAPEEHIKRFIRRPIAPDQKIVGSPEHIVTLLVNAILCVVEHSSIEQPLSLFVDAAWLDYRLGKNYEKKLARALRLVMTTETQEPASEVQSYYPYDDSKYLNDWDHVSMLENKRIVSAHYGFIDLQKDGNTMTQTYVLPLDLKSVRPKMMRFASEDLLNKVQIEDDVDKSFLQAVKAGGFKLPRISLALKVAKHYHKPQTRNSGEPFYLHPMIVATILLKYTKDEDSIVSALLHDTIEDTEYSMYQLTAMFGNNVARIVRQVTHLYNQKNRPKIKLGKSETLDRLIASGNQDALTVKLADRLHNMRTLKYKPRDKQITIAKETLDMFIPMAKKLKLKPIEQELKQLVDDVLKSKA